MLWVSRMFLIFAGQIVIDHVSHIYFQTELEFILGFYNHFQAILLFWFISNAWRLNCGLSFLFYDPNSYCTTKTVMLCVDRPSTVNMVYTEWCQWPSLSDGKGLVTSGDTSVWLRRLEPWFHMSGSNHMRSDLYTSLEKVKCCNGFG